MRWAGRNGFGLLEFVIVLRVPDLGGRVVEQHNFSGHLARDGYWVDVHLSMMPYTPKDRRVFLDFVGAIKVEPKGK